MAINPGDILFTRSGRPALVTGRDANSAEVALQDDLKEVQNAAPFGIKNGLDRRQRDEFESNRFASLSEDKRQEILALRERIRDLREKNSDQKVIHYLENELQHLVIREGITPSDYMVSERTLVKG